MVGMGGLKRLMGGSLNDVGKVMKVLVDNQDEQIQLLKEIRDSLKKKEDESPKQE